MPSAYVLPLLTESTPLPSAPCVNSVADDDPASLCHLSASLPFLDNGRGTSEFDSEDDDLDFACFNRPFAIELNAIDIQRPVFLQSYDIQTATSNIEDVSVISEIPCGVASPKMKKALEIESETDPDAPRAQIDSGAFTSCTDQQHMLHKYREFSPEYSCPVTLMPASEGSDIVPKGVGYLHVPAPNAQGHIAIRTFYHPSLRTTVIDERDFLRFAGQKPKDFTGERIEKYNDAGTFTFHASHRLRRSQDVCLCAWYSATW